MKICVVVPGEDHLATAGVRIRYQRIGARLAAAGHELVLSVIDNVQPSAGSTADIYLICKCYDARGIVLAAELRARGHHIGADFFDDYYSQGNDSRFVHLRQWLKEIGTSLTFALCSTPLMRQNLRELVPQLPCHMMNDPYDDFDVEKVAASIDTRLERVRRTGRLPVGWFGIGDNPYFPVGLSDLQVYDGVLAELASTGLTPELTVLTNRRAMSVERLEMLGRLPVPCRIEEWSEEAERQVVSESLVCFLPVNAQRFSMVKSLNRAVTALTGGAQVLSAGYPLYDSFADLIYRDSASLLADVARGEPRLRRETLPALSAALDHNANPEHEAAGLVAFLQALTPVNATGTPSFAIVHGKLSLSVIHKYAQKLGYLSVAGPVPEDLNYDVRLTTHPQSGAAIVQLSPTAMKRLRPELVPKAKSFTAANGKKYHLLPLAEEPLNRLGARRPPLMEYDAVFLASYAADIGTIEALLGILFDRMTVIISESISPYCRGPGPDRSVRSLAS